MATRGIRLSKEIVEKMYELHERGYTHEDIADKLGVCKNTVGRKLRGMFADGRPDHYHKGSKICESMVLAPSEIYEKESNMEVSVKMRNDIDIEVTKKASSFEAKGKYLGFTYKYAGETGIVEMKSERHGELIMDAINLGQFLKEVESFLITVADCMMES